MGFILTHSLVFAIALELPEETFVNMHKFDVNDESWMRYMKYYDEYSAEEQKTIEGVWLGGHTDFGSLTLLFSQPMCSLQVRREQDGQWQFVKHLPGGMVVNAGQFMDWLTGGFFKAAIHRVAAPPNDQRNHERCGVFYFVVPNDDVFVSSCPPIPFRQKYGTDNSSCRLKPRCNLPSYSAQASSRDPKINARLPKSTPRLVSRMSERRQSSRIQRRPASTMRRPSLVSRPSGLARDRAAALIVSPIVDTSILLFDPYTRCSNLRVYGNKFLQTDRRTASFSRLEIRMARLNR